MKISEMITDRYKLRIPPTVYYDLLADVQEAEEEQEPTTKNDLVVDWENYKDADGTSLDYLILNVLQNNFDCGDTYGYTVADKIISLLPSVTPQEPVLDKIRAEIETKYGQCKLTEHIVQYDGICTSVNEIGDIADVLQIIDKYKAETEET